MVCSDVDLTALKSQKPFMPVGHCELLDVCPEGVVSSTY